MKTRKQIGWQKYEDVIEDQITNPFIDHIISKLATPRDNPWEDNQEEDFFDEEDMTEEMTQGGIPISNDLVQELSLAVNYDCWLGHANFNITPEMKTKLKKTPGVEALKIISRYRFFIGVGKMFDFAEVREFIENQHCNKIKEDKDDERSIE
jgi:hypothetical protein|tara:strand:+ start:1569 stop:2024 length:456 start_codon:yes stop_codon:yes gene_type:complete